MQLQKRTKAYNNNIMLKIIILLLVVAILVFRAVWIMYNNRNIGFLLISFFIIATAFHYSYAIVPGAANHNGGGALGPDVRITVSILLLFLLLPFTKFKKLSFKKNIWVNVILLFILISIFNPYNHSPVSTAAFIVFFFSQIILFENIFTVFFRESN